VAAVVAAVCAYLVARATPLFALDTVEVRGAPAPLEHEIQGALQPLHGESLLAFRTSQAAARLAPLTEVASVSYDRAFPHTLRVTVRAEHPVAVLRQGAHAWLAAASGRVLAGEPKNAHPRYPRIWLPASASVSTGRGVPDFGAVRALRALWIVQATGFGPWIRFVRSSSREFTLVLRSGVELRLGDDEWLPLKLAIARRLLRDVEVPQKGPPYLDLTVPERPVASVTNPQVTSSG
jgi:cell division septal protein FtsQ